MRIQKEPTADLHLILKDTDQSFPSFRSKAENSKRRPERQREKKAEKKKG